METSVRTVGSEATCVVTPSAHPCSSSSSESCKNSMDSGLGYNHEKNQQPRILVSRPKKFGLFHDKELSQSKSDFSREICVNRDNVMQRREAVNAYSSEEEEEGKDREDREKEVEDKPNEYCTVSSAGYRCVSYQRNKQLLLDRTPGLNNISSGRKEMKLCDQQSKARQQSKQDDKQHLRYDKNPEENTNNLVNGQKPSYSGKDIGKFGACFDESLSPTLKRSLYHRKHYPPGLVKITALPPTDQYSSDGGEGGGGDTGTGHHVYPQHPILDSPSTSESPALTDESHPSSEDFNHSNDRNSSSSSFENPVMVYGRSDQAKNNVKVCTNNGSHQIHPSNASMSDSVNASPLQFDDNDNYSNEPGDRAIHQAHSPLSRVSHSSPTSPSPPPVTTGVSTSSNGNPGPGRSGGGRRRRECSCSSSTSSISTEPGPFTGAALSSSSHSPVGLIVPPEEDPRIKTPDHGPLIVNSQPGHISNGGHPYTRIPVVRIELVEEEEEEEVVQDNRETSCNRLNPEEGIWSGTGSGSMAGPIHHSQNKSSRRAQEQVQEDDCSMEDNNIGGGGLQAIDLEELQRRRRTRQKKKNKFIKNILILSFSFVSLFSATSGLIILQSSLNRRMGVFGLCANFVAVAISCLLLPKALIQLLGCKWTIVASMGCFMLWIMSNLHPTWATLIPSAVVMGTGWAPLWTAQCTYFTVTGIEYAKWADDMPDVVIARMFGIFFMIFMTASIWGNLLSSSVLSNSNFNNRSRALPLPGDPESIYRFCGAADCPDIYANITNENYNRPENSLVYTLVGLYLGLSLIGLTLVAFFLDRLELERDAGKPRCTAVSFTASLKQIINPYQIFIIPLTIYTGMEQVFLTVEYTRAYATCALGMEKIGYVVISYATVAALFSLASSQLVNVVGRMPLFLIGAGAHIGCMVVFMRWTPYPDSLIMFIIMPAIWGIGDAIWQSQINAFYGVLFSDQSEAAFANYRMWESVGFIMSLSYSPFLCVYLKIYILIGCLITGLVGYFVVEGMYSKESSERETELAKKGIAVDPDTSESDGAPFSGLAQMIRRKSSVYLPQSAVREAAEVMRRKSNAFLTPGMDNPEQVIRRRLSTFAPVMEENEENTPNSSVCSTPVAHPRADSLIMASEDVFEAEHSKMDEDSDNNEGKPEAISQPVVDYHYKREYQV